MLIDLLKYLESLIHLDWYFYSFKKFRNSTAGFVNHCVTFKKPLTWQTWFPCFVLRIKTFLFERDRASLIGTRSFVKIWSSSAQMHSDGI